MPGRKVVLHNGLRYFVRPRFWLRRWSRFPFYFESTNPSFDVEISRVSDSTSGEYWPDGGMEFQVIFADGTVSTLRVGVPDLQVGNSSRITLGEVYTSHPGQTIIRLLVNEHVLRGTEWKTLYSYQVRTEEQLWLWLFGPIVGLFLGVGSTTFGFPLRKWVG
jgi:hypothetical protein